MERREARLDLVGRQSRPFVVDRADRAAIAGKDRDIGPATVGHGIASRAFERSAAESGLTVEVLRGHRERTLRLEDLKPGVVLENRELVNMAMPGARSKRHIAIRLPEGMTYRAGDYLSVLASNPGPTVERVMARFELAPEAEVVVPGATGPASPLPLDRPMSVLRLFSDYVELQQPATRGQIQRLAEATPCPPEAQALTRLT